jgi:tetratricopeptide (TPR) repeat protein
MRLFKNADANHQYKLAIEELNRGLTNNAITLLDRSLEKNEEHIPSLELRANINSNLNKWNKTLNDFIKIKSLDANFKNINLLIGNSYFFTRNYDKAIEFLTIHNQSNLKYFEAYLHRAYSFLAINQPDKALLDINEAIDIVPRNIELYIVQGNIYEELEDFENALQSFNKAFHLEKEELSTFQTLGHKLEFLQRINQNEKAISIVSEIILENPYNAFLYLKRGQLYKANQNIELAKNDYMIALNYGIFEAKTELKNIA